MGEEPARALHATPIGLIRSPWHEMRCTPVQTVFAPGACGPYEPRFDAWQGHAPDGAWGNEPCAAV